MIGFHRRHSTLFCEDVPLETLAQAEGTPLYVYSAGIVRDRVAQFQTALGGAPNALHYALKANSNLAIVRLVHGLGCGVDASVHRRSVSITSPRRQNRPEPGWFTDGNAQRTRTVGVDP